MSLTVGNQGSALGHFFQVVVEKSDVVASACAVARAFPLFTHKSSASQLFRTVTVEFVVVGTGIIFIFLLL